MGGTTGAIFTCPLEVVKTRLQSSNSGFPTCDGPHCDYVPIKSKKDKTKLAVGYHKEGANNGTTGGAEQSVRRGYSTLSSIRGQNAVHVKYQAISADHIAAETRRGFVQTTIPVASKSAMSNQSSLRFIASTTRDLNAKSIINNTYPTSSLTSTQINKSYQQQPTVNASYRHRYFKPWDITVKCTSTINNQAPPNPPKSMNVFQCLKFIYLTEGIFGLWKGIGPNLMGVAPSRAIYFWAYSTSKKNINAMLPRKNRDTPFVHVVSAMSAGFSASTTTNPIWLIKTRLQLDRATSKHRLTVKRSIIDIYKESVSNITHELLLNIDNFREISNYIIALQHSMSSFFSGYTRVLERSHCFVLGNK